MARVNKKKRFANFIVTLVIILNTLFTIGVLYVFMKVGSEPSVLIGSWFAFTTGELWMLSSIKKSKVANSTTTETVTDATNNF